MGQFHTYRCDRGERLTCIINAVSEFRARRFIKKKSGVAWADDKDFEFAFLVEGRLFIQIEEHFNSVLY